MIHSSAGVQDVVIQTEGLTKTFRVPEREGGFSAAMRSLWRRRYKDVHAVADVTLKIAPGEIVGFLGPNGAGKTTTLKMLAGLLHPSAGSAKVNGFVPWRREARFLRQISLVMGQRSQLNWDLPAMDSFLVQQAVYGVDHAAGRKTLDTLIELLDLGGVLKKQVRTLSLGERMKCELCMALLYQPRVLFLDEPTIGVDITMQARIRGFIAEHNRASGATVILTSHYMADVTALCRRIIVIDKGRLLFDGPLTALVARLAPFKVITIDLDRDLSAAGSESNGANITVSRAGADDGAGTAALGAYDFSGIGEIVAREPRKITLRVAKEAAPAAAARLLAELPVLDLTIADPPIEDVIARVFAG